MRNGRVLLATLLVMIVAGIGIVAWWKAAGKQKMQAIKSGLTPKVTLMTLNITDIGPEVIKAVSAIQIENTLPVASSADSLSYQLFIGNDKVLESRYPKSVDVKSRDTATLRLPLNLKLDAINKAEAKDLDSADYKVKTHFRLNVPVAGKRDFEFQFVKRLPAIRKIEFRPAKVKIDKLGAKETKLDVVMQVNNHNAFPIKMKDGKYTVIVDKELKMDGDLQKLVNIPAKGSTKITMYLDLKTANVPGLLWKMLFKKKDTPYET